MPWSASTYGCVRLSKPGPRTSTCPAMCLVRAFWRRRGIITMNEPGSKQIQGLGLDRVLGLGTGVGSRASGLNSGIYGLRSKSGLCQCTTVLFCLQDRGNWYFVGKVKRSGHSHTPHVNTKPCTNLKLCPPICETTPTYFLHVMILDFPP